MKTKFKSMLILALTLFFAGFAAAQEPVPVPTFSHPSGVVEYATTVKVYKGTADKLFVWQTSDTTWPQRFNEVKTDSLSVGIYSSPRFIWAYSEKDGKTSDTVKAAYVFPTPDEPVFSVVAGKVKVGTQVSLTCPMAGAKIYYAYGNGEFVQYSSPFLVCENLTVKAYAEKNFINSKTVEVAYTVEVDETLEAPAFSHLSGSLIEKDSMVAVYKDKTKADTMYIWRTADTTGMPSWTKLSMDTIKYKITGNTYIWAIAEKDGKRSKMAKASYALLPPQHPVFKPAGSELNVGDSVELSSATKAATLWYAEGKAEFKQYRSKFPIYNDVTIKAFAKNGVNSDTVKATYTVKVNAGLEMPEFRVPNGTLVDKGSLISVYKKENTDYMVVWRTGDTTTQPQWSAFEEDSVRYPLNGDMYIWAFSVKDGQRSPIAKRAYSFNAVKPEAPTFSEEPGDGLTRTIWVRKGNADELYYTNNGVLEGGDTIFRPIMYGQKDSGSVFIGAPKMMVLGYNTNKGPWGTILYSDTVSATYTAYVIAPHFKFEAGSGNAGDVVKVYWKSGSLGYMSVNEDRFMMAEEGTYGREGDMNVKTYVVHDSMVRIRAYAQSGSCISDTVTFNIDEYRSVAAPVFSIASATEVEKGTLVYVRKGQADTLFMWQTTDTAGTPNFVKTVEDSLGVGITATKFIWAYTVKNGRASDMAKAFYTIKTTEAPVFAPAQGDILKGSKVTITAVEGAEIYVAKGNGAFAKYTEAIVVDEDVTLKAFAVKENYNNSDTVLAAYVVKEAPEAPAFNPGAGEVESGTQVRVTCATPRAEVYVDKGDGQFVKFTAPITVTEEVTLRAFSSKEGFNSDTVEAKYTIKPVANEENELAGVSVYPNPNKGEFSINVPDNAVVEVFAANGSKVVRVAVSAGKNAMKLDNAGVYFVRISANGQSVVKKVVVR